MSVCDPSSWITSPHACTLDNWMTQVSELQFGMMIAIMVAVPLYVKYEDPIPPAMGLLLVAGFLWAALPGAVANIAWVVLFFAIATAVFTIFYKSSL